MVKHIRALAAQLLFLGMGVAFLGGFSEANGQVQEEINIVKSYKPELTKAVKMDLQPEAPELELREPTLSYQVEPVFSALPPTRTQLPGVSLGQQQLDPLRANQIKLGGGNYANFLAEATYNTKRNDQQAVGAYARHNSGGGPVNNADFSEQILELRGKQLFDQSTLTVSPFFRRNRFHRYGLASDTSISQDAIQQDYLRYGLNTKLHNQRSDRNTINYQVQIQTRDLRAGSQAGETDLGLKGYVKEHFNGNGVRIDAAYRFLDYRSPSGSFQRNVIRFGGRYIINSDKYGQAELGFRTASVADSADEPFRFYPYIRVNYPLLPDTLTLFGGIKGALSPRTYHGLTQTNPFLQTDANLRSTNKQFDIFAGAKGHLGEDLNYLAQLSYQNIENMALYVNDPGQQRQFNVIYDTAITTLFQLHTELEYQPADHFSIGLNLNLRDFNMGAQPQPWHRPALDYQLTGHYHFGDKIRLRAAFHGFGKRQARQPDGTSEQLSAIFDMNTGIDYRFSSPFTAFFDFKNLLGSEYQYWNQYPVRGFHVVGGIKLDLFK